MITSVTFFIRKDWGVRAVDLDIDKFEICFKTKHPTINDIELLAKTLKYECNADCVEYDYEVGEDNA